MFVHSRNISITEEANWSQKFQDLEEERLDFTKSSLWAYANIASTVCVSDDAVGSIPLVTVYGLCY